MAKNNYTNNADTIGKWLETTGPFSDVIMSTRIRLARDLYKVPFPGWGKKEELQMVRDKVFSAAAPSEYLKDAFFIKMSELPENDRDLLVERHLISKDLLNNIDAGGIILTKNEEISIMVNEEDHIRIQVFAPGFNLDDLYGKIDKIDDDLEAKLDYGYSSIWGYDTACITNAGTGLRVSCLFHLPALIISKKIPELIKAVSQFGLTVRGLYGEGTDALGAFFQISNQISLGISEKEIIEKVHNISSQIVNYERLERKNILQKDGSAFEDAIMRSLGILTFARKISTQEAYDRLSSVKLGIDIGLITDIAIEKIRKLLVIVQPAHLQKINGAEFKNVEERDVFRAQIIRKVLGEVK